MAVKLGLHGRELSDIYLIEGIGVSSNVYVIGDNRLTLVDAGAGDEANQLVPKIKTLNLDPANIEQIVLTHGHFDHTGGIEEIAGVSSPKVLIHNSDSDDLETYGLELVKLHDDAMLDAGNHHLQVIHTSGHTSGSTCMYDSRDNILFSGDTVFPEGSFGRTDLGGNNEELVKSLERLTRLEVSFMLPGHMRPITRNVKLQIQTSYQNALTWL